MCSLLDIYVYIKLFGFPIFRLSVYVMKVNLENVVRTKLDIYVFILSL